MRRVLMMMGAAVLTLGVAGSAQAQTVQLAATLSGANETPGVVTGAYGTATVHRGSRDADRQLGH